MTVDDAVALLAPALDAPSPRAEVTAGALARWADLGAGRGTFTQALARLLGRVARVDAVDRDAAAVASLARLRQSPTAAPIVAHRADFTDGAALSALQLPPLDGVLLANALHFVPASRQLAVLADLVARLADGGRVVVVEYEERGASRWVPSPVPFARFHALADALIAAGGRLSAPVRAGSRPSAFGGTMYVAHVARIIGSPTGRHDG